MMSTLLSRQAELPNSIPLISYGPPRKRFVWEDLNPAAVRSARWQGSENDTYFEVKYDAKARRWELQQTWCGHDGGYSNYPSYIPLTKLIPSSLYIRFPSEWSIKAKSKLESAYQMTALENQEMVYNFCGLPDGAFRTIILPVSVRNLRYIQQWLQNIIDESQPNYPIHVEAKLLFQEISHLVPTVCRFN